MFVLCIFFFYPLNESNWIIWLNGIVHADFNDFVVGVGVVGVAVVIVLLCQCCNKRDERRTVPGCQLKMETTMTTTDNIKWCRSFRWRCCATIDHVSSYSSTHPFRWILISIIFLWMVWLNAVFDEEWSERADSTTQVLESITLHDVMHVYTSCVSFIVIMLFCLIWLIWLLFLLFSCMRMAWSPWNAIVSLLLLLITAMMWLISCYWGFLEGYTLNIISSHGDYQSSLVWGWGMKNKQYQVVTSWLEIMILRMLSRLKQNEWIKERLLWLIWFE